MKTFRLLVFLSVYILVFSACFAQQFLWYKGYDVDSLTKVLADQEGEERVRSLNNLAFSLYHEDFAMSRQYADKAMRLSEELEYREGLAESYLNLGYIFHHQGDYPEALNHYFTSLSFYELLNDRYKVARLNEEIAGTYFTSKNFEKALEYGNIAMDIFREQANGGHTVGSIQDTMRVYLKFAFLYGETLGMIEKPLQMYRTYLEVGKKHHFDATDMLLSTFILGTYFHDLGQMDSARLYFEKALAFPDANPSIQTLKYRCLIWLGFIHYAEGNFDSAVSNMKAALSYYTANGFLWMAMLTGNRLADLYYKEGNFNRAEEYFRKSENLFQEMQKRNSLYRYDSLRYIVSFGTELYDPTPEIERKEKMWDLARWLYNRMYKISFGKKRTADALHYYIAYSGARDTLNKLSRSRETMEMAVRYESERKDQQIGFLSKENEFKDTRIRQSGIIVFSLAGLVILVVILAIMLIRQNRLREQQKILLLQQKLFRSQMNPHFLFNSLSSIHNYIIHEEPAKAGQYLSKFSKLMRNILDCSVEEYIPLEEEITTIETYLDLQKLRFPEKFDFSIEVDKAIDTESITIPPMLLQPFIENSIEHGFKHKEGKGNIKISFIPNIGDSGHLTHLANFRILALSFRFIH
ncbi:MAG: histidine kinase [Bacteroidia bacterium]|nr:histidine kinase [Bacteroidia bacterium]